MATLPKVLISRADYQIGGVSHLVSEIKEYLPALERDPGALGLKVGCNEDGSIRIYQPPGERNALGRVRFNFPNRFLVYQHDTPNKNLFEKTARAYSHGCMRVENPDQYAEVLLSVSQPEEGYSVKRIRLLYGGDERTINLNNPIPVYITYQAAFLDNAGQLQVRPDIYSLDKEMTSLLHGDSEVADIPIHRDYGSNRNLYWRISRARAEKTSLKGATNGSLVGSGGISSPGQVITDKSTNTDFGDVVSVSRRAFTVSFNSLGCCQSGTAPFP
jgi:hypothetical protein